MLDKRLAKLETDMAVAKKQLQEMDEAIKAEAKRTEEMIQKYRLENIGKIRKVNAEMDSLKMLGEVWMFQHVAKKFEPKVLAGVSLEDFYDPVQILKSGNNPEVAHPSKEQIVKLKVMFAINNKCGDGVSSKELESIMKSLGKSFTELELQSMIKQTDADADGYLTFHEFLSLMKHELKKDTDSEEELKEAFYMIDKDQDGYILTNELLQLMSNFMEKLTPQEVEGIERLSFSDFKQIMLGTK